MFQRYLIVVAVVVVVEVCGGGFSGPPTLRFSHRAMAFLYFAPPHHGLSLPNQKCRKKISLTRGTFLLHLAQLLPILVKTTRRASEPTHREHIYPGKGPEHFIPMDMLGGKNCRADFTRKYPELDMAHPPFFYLSFSSLVSTPFFTSHPLHSNQASMF